MTKTIPFQNTQDLQGNLEHFQSFSFNKEVKVFVDWSKKTVTVPDDCVFPTQSYTCPDCGGKLYFRTYCGAYVCEKCDNHLGLSNCFCGWGHSDLRILAPDLYY